MAPGCTAGRVPPPYGGTFEEDHMMIMFDPLSEAIYAEMPTGVRHAGRRHLLTWPLTEAPESAVAIAPHTLFSGHYYPVGVPRIPYDAGDVGGDMQIGVAWKRRWASWHNNGQGHYWRVAELTAWRFGPDPAMDEPTGPGVTARWEFTTCASLHGVYDDGDEDGYDDDLIWLGDCKPADATDEQVKSWVALYTDDVVTVKANDWFEEDHR